MSYTYEISIRGYGGEFTLGRVTNEQYQFWKNDNTVMSVLKGYENADEAFSDYITDIWDYEEDESIPDNAKFEYEWHEHDDIYHIYGANYYSSWISIVQTNGDIEDEVIDETMENFCNKISNAPEWAEGNDWPEEENVHVLESISSEKGTFFHGILEAKEPIDFKKFKFYLSESWNEEEIVTDVEYDGEPIDNEGGDTNGKGYWFTLHQI